MLRAWHAHKAVGAYCCCAQVAAGVGYAAAQPVPRYSFFGAFRCEGRRAIAELVAENGKLRDIIKEQEKVIEVQAAVIVELKSKCRALQGELDAARRDIKGLEQRPTKEVLGEVKEKLAEERKARRAAERRVSEMTKERTKLRRMLTLAERGFDEAEAAMEAAQAAEKLATSAKAAAQVRAAEAELQAAAQVVLAQEEAATWMTEALDEAVAAEVEKRGLQTMDEWCRACVSRQRLASSQSLCVP